MKLTPDWVVGFVDGEGCFQVRIEPHPESSSGYEVLPEFVVVQHERDVQLLYALKSFFGCGVVRRNHGEQMVYRVRRREHLRDRIIPFFEKHPLKSKKRIDFIRFRRVVLLMEQGAHRTPDGLERIRSVVARMGERSPKRESRPCGNTGGT